MFLKLLALLVLLPSFCIGQSQKIADSLYDIYSNKSLSDDETMILLGSMAYNEINDFEKAISYSDELIALAKKNNNFKQLQKGFYQKAISLRYLGNLSQALEMLFKSAEVCNANGMTDKLHANYLAIADVYSESGNSNNAILYYDKALEIYRAQNNEVGVATVLLNAGDEYFNTKNYQKALSNFEEAIILFETNDHVTGKAYAFGNMGMVYAQTGQPEKALEHINKAITILEETQDYYAISEYLTFMSDIYLEKNDLELAEAYSIKSLELAEKYGLKKQISETTLQLSTLNENAGNNDKALSYLKTHFAYRDSIHNLENIQTMADLRTNFEVSQKQTEVDLLSQQKKNQRLVLFASLLALSSILVIAVGLYRRNKYVNSTNQIIAQEKDRSEKLLLNILPEKTAQELKIHGKVRAQRFDSVSVMFTDFISFTNHSEHLSPEELVESVDFYFSKFDKIIEKHGLEKIKTIGDAYMCACGLPIEKENHVELTIKAANDIINFVESIKHDNPDYKTRFEIRVGISSGPVVAGVVGSKKLAYDIWGDTVNTAARMERYSEPGKINVSEFTYDLVKDKFQFEERGQIEVKNKGLMSMYFLKPDKTNTEMSQQSKEKSKSI